MAYDPIRNEVMAFGGTAAFGSTVPSDTNILRANTWRQPFVTWIPRTRPRPRSLGCLRDRHRA